jgi:TRAP-type C4-dicarboxylate transport system permease small subunit
MYKILRWADRHGEEVVVLALLWFIIAVVTVEVFRRYVLQSAGEYSEEIARASMIWMVYLGVPYAIKRRNHIVVDILPHSLPRWINHSVNIIAHICFGILALAIVKYGADVVGMQLANGKRMESMGISYAFLSLAPVVGCSLALLRLGQAIWHEIAGMRGRESGSSDIETPPLIF